MYNFMAGNYLKLYINIYYLETFIRKTSRCGNFKSKVGNDVGCIITFLNIKKRIMLLKPACKIILQLQLKIYNTYLFTYSNIYTSRFLCDCIKAIA